MRDLTCFPYPCAATIPVLIFVVNRVDGASSHLFRLRALHEQDKSGMGSFHVKNSMSSSRGSMSSLFRGVSCGNQFKALMVWWKRAKRWNLLSTWFARHKNKFVEEPSTWRTIVWLTRGYLHEFCESVLPNWMLFSWGRTSICLSWACYCIVVSPHRFVCLFVLFRLISSEGRWHIYYSSNCTPNRIWLMLVNT